MSVDITSNAVQLVDGKIILEGTGIAGQKIDIFIPSNSSSSITTVTVKADNHWVTDPFVPPSGAGTYSVKAKVRTEPKQQIEDVTVANVIVSPIPLPGVPPAG